MARRDHRYLGRVARTPVHKEKLPVRAAPTTTYCEPGDLAPHAYFICVSVLNASCKRTVSRASQRREADPRIPINDASPPQHRTLGFDVEDNVEVDEVLEGLWAPECGDGRARRGSPVGPHLDRLLSVNGLPCQSVLARPRRELILRQHGVKPSDALPCSLVRRVPGHKRTGVPTPCQTRAWRSARVLCVVPVGV